MEEAERMHLMAEVLQAGKKNKKRLELVFSDGSFVGCGRVFLWVILLFSIMVQPLKTPFGRV